MFLILRRLITRCSGSFCCVPQRLDCILDFSAKMNKPPRSICMEGTQCTHFPLLCLWSPGKHSNFNSISFIKFSFITCSMISALTIVALPTEVYSFGWMSSFSYPFALFCVFFAASYLFLPVYFQCGVDNCYKVSFEIFSRQFSQMTIDFCVIFRKIKSVFGCEVQSNRWKYGNSRMDTARDVIHSDCSIRAISGFCWRFVFNAIQLKNSC